MPNPYILRPIENLFRPTFNMPLNVEGPQLKNTPPVSVKDADDRNTEWTDCWFESQAK